MVEVIHVTDAGDIARLVITQEVSPVSAVRRLVQLGRTKKYAEKLIKLAIDLRTEINRVETVECPECNGAGAVVSNYVEVDCPRRGNGCTAKY